MKITKETLKRALRTFIQSLIAYLVVALNAFDLSGDAEEIKKAALGLLIPAIAAGLAAVMNLEKGTPNEADDTDELVPNNDINIDGEV